MNNNRKENYAKFVRSSLDFPAQNLPGLTYQKISGDGDCLYNAIGLHIGKDAQFIRNIVATNLEQNKDEYEPIVAGLLRPGDTFKSYVNGIRSREWADNLEISILMRLLNRAILVVHPDGRIEHRDAVNAYLGDPIFVSYNGHDHYDALIRNSDLTGRQVFDQLTQLSELSPFLRESYDDDSWLIIDDAQDESITHTPAFSPSSSSELLFSDISMPVLDKLTQYFQAKLAVDANYIPHREETAFVFVQQGFVSVGPMMEALVSLGIAPDQIWMTTKPHTTTPEMREYFVDRGFHYIDFISDESQGDYETRNYKTMERLLSELNHHLFTHPKLTKNNVPIKYLVICDEGGRFTEKFIDSYSGSHYDPRAYPENHCQVVCIGHTKSDTYNPALKHLSFPFINMAECFLKTCVEAPVIADSILEEMRLPVSNLFLQGQKVIGIVGCGSIGFAALRQIIESSVELFGQLPSKIVVYDLDNSVLSQGKLKELVKQDKRWAIVQRVDRPEKIFQQSDIVMGITGQDITKNIDFEKLGRDKPLHLFSGSSGTREFKTLLDRKDLLHSDQGQLKIPNPSNAHQSLAIIYNDGRPMNFTAEKDDIPPELIQVTRAMKLASVAQALKLLYLLFDIHERPHYQQWRKGYIQLDAELQDEIARWYYKDLAKKIPERAKFYNRELQDLTLEKITEKSVGIPMSVILLDDKNYLQHYLQEIIAKYDHIPIQSIVKDSLPPPPLDKLYVALTVDTTSRSERVTYENDEALWLNKQWKNGQLFPSALHEKINLAREQLAEEKSCLPDTLTAQEVIQESALLTDTDKQLAQNCLHAQRDAFNVKKSSQRYVDPSKRSITLQQAYEQFSYFIVLGDPGSGKTTLSHWLAVKMAKAYLNGESRLMVPSYQVNPSADRKETGEVNFGQHVRVPLYIPVWSYAQFYAQASDHRSLRDFITARYPQEAPTLLRLYQQGRLLLLLDGFDEIAHRADREAIIGELNDFLQLLTKAKSDPLRDYGNRLIITSRVAGDYVSGLDKQFARVTIEPLTESALGQFFKRWFEIDPEVVGNSDKLGAELFEQVVKDDKLRTLVSTPQLATVVAFVYKNCNYQLPQSKIELYKTAIDCFLRRWEVRLAESRVLVEAINQLPKIYLPEFLLPYLAFKFHKATGPLNEKEIADCLREKLAEDYGTTISYIDREQYVKELCLVMNQDIGLLVGYGAGTYQFVHRQFQEYLSGVYLLQDNPLSLRRNGETSSLVERFSYYLTDLNWHEPIRLALAKLREEDASKWSSLAKDLLRLSVEQTSAIPLFTYLLIDSLSPLPLSMHSQRTDVDLVTELLRSLSQAYASQCEVGCQAMQQHSQLSFATLLTAGFKQEVSRACVILLDESSVTAVKLALLLADCDYQDDAIVLSLRRVMMTNPSQESHYHHALTKLLKSQISHHLLEKNQLEGLLRSPWINETAHFAAMIALWPGYSSINTVKNDRQLRYYWNRRSVTKEEQQHLAFWQAHQPLNLSEENHWWLQRRDLIVEQESALLYDVNQVQQANPLTDVFYKASQDNISTQTLKKRLVKKLRVSPDVQTQSSCLLALMALGEPYSGYQPYWVEPQLKTTFVSQLTQLLLRLQDPVYNYASQYLETLSRLSQEEISVPEGHFMLIWTGCVDALVELTQYFPSSERLQLPQFHLNANTIPLVALRLLQIVLMNSHQKTSGYEQECIEKLSLKQTVSWSSWERILHAMRFLPVLNDHDNSWPLDRLPLQAWTRLGQQEAMSWQAISQIADLPASSRFLFNYFVSGPVCECLKEHSGYRVEWLSIVMIKMPLDYSERDNLLKKIDPNFIADANWLTYLQDQIVLLSPYFQVRAYLRLAIDQVEKASNFFQLACNKVSEIKAIDQQAPLRLLIAEYAPMILSDDDLPERFESLRDEAKKVCEQVIDSQTKACLLTRLALLYSESDAITLHQRAITLLKESNDTLFLAQAIRLFMPVWQTQIELKESYDALILQLQDENLFGYALGHTGPAMKQALALVSSRDVEKKTRWTPLLVSARATDWQQQLGEGKALDRLWLELLTQRSSNVVTSLLQHAAGNGLQLTLRAALVLDQLINVGDINLITPLLPILRAANRDTVGVLNRWLLSERKIVRNAALVLLSEMQQRFLIHNISEAVALLTSPYDIWRDRISYFLHQNLGRVNEPKIALSVLGKTVFEQLVQQELQARSYAPQAAVQIRWLGAHLVHDDVSVIQSWLERYEAGRSSHLELTLLLPVNFSLPSVIEQLLTRYSQGSSLPNALIEWFMCLVHQQDVDAKTKYRSITKEQWTRFHSLFSQLTPESLRDWPVTITTVRESVDSLVQILSDTSLSMKPSVCDAWRARCVKTLDTLQTLDEAGLREKMMQLHKVNRISDGDSEKNCYQRAVIAIDRNAAQILPHLLAALYEDLTQYYLGDRMNTRSWDSLIHMLLGVTVAAAKKLTWQFTNALEFFVAAYRDFPQKLLWAVQYKNNYNVREYAITLFAYLPITIQTLAALKASLQDVSDVRDAALQTVARLAKTQMQFDLLIPDLARHLSSESQLLKLVNLQCLAMVGAQSTLTLAQKQQVMTLLGQVVMNPVEHCPVTVFCDLPVANLPSLAGIAMQCMMQLANFPNYRPEYQKKIQQLRGLALKETILSGALDKLSAYCRQYNQAVTWDHPIVQNIIVKAEHDKQESIIDALVKEPTLMKALQQSPFDVLHSAVIKGHSCLSRSLIKQFPKLVNQKDTQGNTLLDLATRFGSEVMVQDLLAAGANYTITNKKDILTSCVSWMVYRGFSDRLKQLDINQYSQGWTNVEWITVITLAINHRQHDMAEWLLIQAKSKDNLLFPDVQDLSSFIAKYCLYDRKKTSPTIDEEVLWLTAAKQGDVALLQSLFTTRRLTYTDHKGNTALHYACQYHQVTVIDFLLAYQNDVAVENNEGLTPMQISVIYNAPLSIIKKLRTKGALLTLQWYGLSLAALAILHGHTDLERYFRGFDDQGEIAQFTQNNFFPVSLLQGKFGANVVANLLRFEKVTEPLLLFRTIAQTDEENNERLLLQHRLKHLQSILPEKNAQAFYFYLQLWQTVLPNRQYLKYISSLFLGDSVETTSSLAWMALGCFYFFVEELEQALECFCHVIPNQLPSALEKDVYFWRYRCHLIFSEILPAIRVHLENTKQFELRSQWLLLEIDNEKKLSQSVIVKRLLQAISDYPRNALAYEKLFQAYANEKLFTQAQQLFEQVQETFSNDPLVLAWLGDCYARKILCKETQSFQKTSRKTTNLQQADLAYKLSLIRYFLGELIYLVTGIDAGRNAWYYVLVNSLSLPAFLKALNDDIIHLEQHGQILFSAYGDDPSIKITQQLKEDYISDILILSDMPALLSRQLDVSEVNWLAVTRSMKMSLLEPDYSSAYSVLLSNSDITSSIFNITLPNGMTALMIAAAYGHSVALRSLLAQGCDPMQQDGQGWTALHHACWHGHEQCIDLLLANTLINTAGFDNETPLQLCVLSGNSLLIVQRLLNHGADIHSSLHGLSIGTLAHLSGEKILEDFFRELGHAPHLDELQNLQPCYALLCRKTIKTICNIIAGLGESLNAQGETWLTLALQLPDEAWCISVVDCLLSYGADLMQVNRAGVLPKELAEQKGYSHVVELFAQDKILARNYVFSISNYIHRQLNKTNAHEHLPRIEQMLSNVSDSVRLEVLEQLSKHKMLLALLKEDPEAWAQSVLNCHGQHVSALFASSCRQQSGNQPVLIWASEKKYIFVCQVLLKNGESWEVADKNGNTPLIKAVKDKQKELVSWLLEQGAMVNQVDQDGNSPLYLVSVYGDAEICQILLDKGASANQAGVRDIIPLHYACWNAHISCVKCLLPYTHDINVLATEGATGLHLAVIDGSSLAIIEYLINNRADLSLRLQGMSVGLLARIRGVEKHIDYLKTQGVEFSLEELAHISPSYFILSDTSCKTLLSGLQELGCNLSVPGANGETWLIFALKQRLYKAVDILLELGVDRTIGNALGETPLAVAKENGYFLASKIKTAIAGKAFSSHRNQSALFKPVSIISSMKHQESKQSQGYHRHPVEADGNCGYTAFGITRNEAITRLIENIVMIRDIIRLPVEQALLTKEFYDYLVAQNALTVPHALIIDNEALRNQYVSDLVVQAAYIHYDVRDKRIDFGWAHPRILQALAHIRHIELHMWCLGKDGVLIPHCVGEESYATYIPPQTDGDRVDLLFINNNHFERLEFIGYENIPNENIYPLNSSWNSAREKIQLIPASTPVVAKSSALILSDTFKGNLHTLFRQGYRFSAEKTNDGYIAIQAQQPLPESKDNHQLLTDVERSFSDLANDYSKQLDEEVEIMVRSGKKQRLWSVQGSALFAEQLNKELAAMANQEEISSCVMS